MPTNHNAGVVSGVCSCVYEDTWRGGNGWLGGGGKFEGIEGFEVMMLVTTRCDPTYVCAHACRIHAGREEERRGSGERAGGSEPAGVRAHANKPEGTAVSLS